MKPLISRIPGTFDVDIEPCPQTRALCAEVAAEARDFMAHAPTQLVVHRVAPEMTRIWEQGLAALEKVGCISSKTIHLTAAECRCGFNLISALVIRKDPPEDSWSSILRCQTLWGMFYHLPIKGRSLPSLEEVWGDDRLDLGRTVYSQLARCLEESSAAISMAGALAMHLSLEESTCMDPRLIALRTELTHITGVWLQSYEVAAQRRERI